MYASAIERLGERMRRSGAQEAGAAREADERGASQLIHLNRGPDVTRDFFIAFQID